MKGAIRIAGGIAVAIAIMYQPAEAQPERVHLYGQTFMHMEGDVVVYTFEDIGAECRYRNTEWKTPVCVGFGDAGSKAASVDAYMLGARRHGHEDGQGQRGRPAHGSGSRPDAGRL